MQGCKSEHGYADECDLGHQYAPADLIAPVSSVTGTVPEMRPVENWYFDLPAFADFLRARVAELEADPEVRAIVPQVVKEFLAPPVVYIKNEAERGLSGRGRQAAFASLPRGRGRASRASR